MEGVRADVRIKVPGKRATAVIAGFRNSNSNLFYSTFVYCTGVIIS